MQPQPNQKIYEMPDPGKLSAASGRALKDLSPAACLARKTILFFFAQRSILKHQEPNPQ